MLNKIKQKIQMKKMPIQKIENDELNQFLSQFNCQQCHNHCPLNKIKCGRGLSTRDEKVKEFQSRVN